MPTFSQFVAPDRALRPDEKGFAAFETAGRRIGPLYREAGQDMARIGELQRQGIEARRWPFDILALEQRSQGGGGIRVRLGRDPMNQFPGGSMAAHHALLQGGDDLSAWFAAANRAGNTVGGQLVDLVNNTTMLGRQEGAGTQLPSNKGGLYGVPGAGGLTSEAPIVDVPPGVDPDFYARQIGANPNAILQQPLPGSVPPSPPQGMVSSVGSAIGNAASAIGNAASDVAGAVGDAASGAFDSTRNFLNTLTGGDQGGGDPGAGM